MRAFDILLKLAKIPSVVGKEEKIIKFIYDLLSTEGFKVIKQKVVGNRFNLLIGSTTPEYVICAHVDTVFFDPPRLEGKRLKGRGVCDDKAGCAIVIDTILSVGTPKNVMFALLVDEESKRALGSYKLARSLRRIKPKVIVLEPTSLKICRKEMGYLEVELRAYGKSVHGGIFWKGENAIGKLTEFVEHLASEHITKRGFNILKFKGGSGKLLVPDEAVCIIDIAVDLGEDTTVVERKLLALSKKFGLDVKIVDRSPPFEACKGELVARLKRALRSVASRKDFHVKATEGKMVSWTDAEHFVRFGMECVIFGPGDLKVCHTKDEYIDVSEVEFAGEVIKEFVSPFLST